MGDVSGGWKTALLAGVGLLAMGGGAQAQERAAQSAEDAPQTGVTSLSLSRMVVSAGAEKVAIDTPQAVTVLDQDDIDQAQASSMGDLIETVPGVSAVGGVSALGQGFNIRGLGMDLGESDSRILFQVDGVTKFFEQYRMGQLFSEPDLYKRIEVLRGPASSTLYGAGAIAGVVNFETKDASDFLQGDDRFALRLRGGYESNADGGFGSAIFAARPAEDLDVLFMANRREMGDYENGDGDTVTPSDVTSDSQLLKARYYINGDRHHNIWASYQRWFSDSTQNYDQQEDYPDPALNFFGLVRREVVDTTAILGYENGFEGNDLLDFKAQFSYANSDVTQTESLALGNYDSTEFSYATWQGRAENTSEFSFGEDWKTFLTFGLQGSYQERRNPRVRPDGTTVPGTTSHPEGDMTRYGVFAQAEIVWNDQLTIIPGVRYDRSEYEPGGAGATPLPAENAEQDATSPKLAALYNFTDWFGVFGSVAHTVRLPVLDEIFSRSATRPYNPDLKPEESDNTEVGFTLSFDNVLSDHDALNFKLTSFRNDVTNLIVTSSSQGLPSGSPFFVNIGESEITGYEIEAEYGAESWYGRLGYSAMEGDNKITHQPLNAIPADELNLTFGYILPSLGLTVGWGGLFASDQHRVPTSVAGSVPREPTDGYTIHNLFATWRPDDGVLNGTEVRLAIDNVTNEQYRPYLSNLDAEGRSVKISLARTF